MSNKYDVDTFSKLRGQAFRAPKISKEELLKLFPPNEDSLNDQIIFCLEKKDVIQTLKLAWLLGDAIKIVTPHIVYNYTHFDATHSEQYPDTFAVQPEFNAWKSELLEFVEQGRINLFPLVQVKLEKISDRFEGWSHVENEIILSNLHKPGILPTSIDFSENNRSNSKDIEIPLLLINNLNLVRKVQSDYPEAAKEFKQMILESYKLAIEKKEELSSSDLLEQIREEIVIPGVDKIKKQQKKILKIHSLKTAIEVTGISVPLVLSNVTDVNDLIIKLLGAGIGLTVARGINKGIDELRELRKTGFYAAMKMNINNEL